MQVTIKSKNKQSTNKDCHYTNIEYSYVRIWLNVTIFKDLYYYFIPDINQSGRKFLFFLTKYPKAASRMYVFAQSSLDLTERPYACTSFESSL